VLKLKYIEDENKIFEKKIGVDENTLKPEGIQKKVESMENLDMNKCRQIHSKESSSINTNPHSYSSASFEDISEVNI
jgi:hypothetical protein